MKPNPRKQNDTHSSYLSPGATTSTGINMMNSGGLNVQAQAGSSTPFHNQFLPGSQPNVSRGTLPVDIAQLQYLHQLQQLINNATPYKTLSTAGQQLHPQQLMNLSVAELQQQMLALQQRTMNANQALAQLQQTQQYMQNTSPPQTLPRRDFNSTSMMPGTTRFGGYSSSPPVFPHSNEINLQANSPMTTQAGNDVNLTPHGVGLPPLHLGYSPLARTCAHGIGEGSPCLLCSNHAGRMCRHGERVSTCSGCSQEGTCKHGIQLNCSCYECRQVSLVLSEQTEGASTQTQENSYKKTFVVEYATTDRSMCKECKGKISKGQVRMGRSLEFEARTLWFHPVCFFSRLKRATKYRDCDASSLAGIERLSLQDKQQVLSLVDSHTANLIGR